VAHTLVYRREDVNAGEFIEQGAKQIELRFVNGAGVAGPIDERCWRGNGRGTARDWVAECFEWALRLDGAVTRQ
jgi:hypothetical protein